MARLFHEKLHGREVVGMALDPGDADGDITMKTAAVDGAPFLFPKSSDTGSYREWLMLAFARRVVSGDARECECEFMRSFMAMELPERNILGDCVTAYNLTAICNGIEGRDCSSFEELFESWQASVPSELRLGGE